LKKTFAKWHTQKGTTPFSVKTKLHPDIHLDINIPAAPFPYLLFLY